jgi:integrase
MPYFDKTKKKWRGVVKVNGERDQALFATKDEAKKWEVERKKELERSQTQTPDDMELRILFSKYLDYAELRFSRVVFKEKRELLRRLTEPKNKLWDGGWRIGDITADMVATFLEGRAKQKSNNTSNRDRKNLLALWNWGVRRLDLSHNPVAKTTTFSHDRAPQYTPPERDILKVLAAASREDRVFLNAYVQTAARRCEIFRWIWNDDINFEKREVRLGTRKTRDGSMKYDWLPMSDTLYADLTWLYANRQIKESPYVFVCTQKGIHYGNPFTARRTFMKNICERAGVKPFGFHAMRRYVASILADKHKASLKSIQTWLRHENLTTTQRYVYSVHDDLRAVANLLNHEISQSTPVSTPINKNGLTNSG